MSHDHGARKGWLILVFLACFAVSSVAATFTANFTISEGDTTYEGQDIVIDGAVTVTIDGPHAFNSLLLTNGAVLTHSPCTVTETHKLDLTVSNQIVISADSRIDVSGKGYLAGRTVGNVPAPASAFYSGGSHGGLGAWIAGSSTPLPVYGTYADPQEWGSGSGYVSGGGLVRLVAGSLELEGQLLANGSNADGSGGAGGGVYVAVGNLRGGGAVRSEGGSSAYPNNYGGGGGGRIAVYATDFSAFDLGNISVAGAVSLAFPGGAGTVYVRDTDEAVGTLIIDAGSGGNGWTPLGLAGTNLFVIADAVVIRGSNTHVQAEHSGLRIEFANTLTVIEGARLELEEAVLGAGSALELGTDSSIIINGPVTSAIPLSIGGGTFMVNGPVILTVPVSIGSGTFIVERLVAPSLTLSNGAVLTCQASTAEQMHRLEVDVAGTVVVDATSRIDVSGKGYLAGRTVGNTTEGASTGLSGGSYGGLGGAFSGSVNGVYGVDVYPLEWGSGGAPGGGTGGGQVWVKAGELVLDGQLLADGQTSTSGGSGGGILVEAQILRGSGTIRAGGGGEYGPTYSGGGGGRVAVYAQELSGFELSRITAPGGQGNLDGGAGTVYITDRAFLSEPVIRAFLSSTRIRSIVLCAQPGQDYVLEVATDLADPAVWEPVWQGTLTNALQRFDNLDAEKPTSFYRVRQ